MQKKNVYKNQNGIMAIYVGVCVLTFIIILAAIFTVAVSVRKNQIKTLLKVKEVYEQDNNKIDDIYEEQKQLIVDQLQVESE